MAQLATLKDRLLNNDLGVIKLLSAPEVIINPNQTISLEFSNYIETKNNDILIFYLNIRNVISGVNIILERTYETTIPSFKQTITSIYSDIDGFIPFIKVDGYFIVPIKRISGNTISGSIGTENFTLSNTKYYKVLITNLDTLNAVSLNAFEVYLERQL
ncbi:MAG: hypothetical protein ABIL47_07985 [candidate division WOR-3 bacterium]